MSDLSNTTSYELCEIKEISPLYHLFNEYKNQEMMLTVTLFILLMYLEEFLFVFRKQKQERFYSFIFLDFHSLEYLLVRLGYARPHIIQTIIFEKND
ncbi:unnamed protein product [Adineta steineri]|uniref:Uncharacterized protein n=1 Tax=Adineta steineri TaxID=433720 RepID=A0A813RC41_9BILA|nr:unnamed protein product [Adineta steineri]